jgi:hypothetical protein
MGGNGVERKDNPQQGSWMRYEFSRLATLRNLALAAIIALGCVGIVFAVAYYAGPRQQVAVAPPPASQPATGKPAPPRYLGQHKLIPPTPEILAQLPPDTSPVVYLRPKNLKRDVHDPMPQWAMQAMGETGPWAQYTDVRSFHEDEQGNVVEPCPSIWVERNKSWGHMVVFSADGKHRYHMYVFKYACGHSADTTPDPYRDLMFANPAAAAKDYASKLCDSCQSLRDYKDAKAQGGGAQGAGARKQAGHG